MGSIFSKRKKKEPILIRVRGDRVDIEVMYSVIGSVRHSSLRNYENYGGSQRNDSFVL